MVETLYCAFHYQKTIFLRILTNCWITRVDKAITTTVIWPFDDHTILCSICAHSSGRGRKLYDCSLHHFTTSQCTQWCNEQSYNFRPTSPTIIRWQIPPWKLPLRRAAKMQLFESELGFKFAILVGEMIHVGQRHDFDSCGQYSYQICSRPEAAGDIISGTFVRQSFVLEARECGDRGLNTVVKPLRKYSTQSRWIRHFRRFLHNNFWRELDNEFYNSAAMSVAMIRCRRSYHEEQWIVVVAEEDRVNQEKTTTTR